MSWVCSCCTYHHNDPSNYDRLTCLICDSRRNRKRSSSLFDDDKDNIESNLNNVNFSEKSQQNKRKTKIKTTTSNKKMKQQGQNEELSIRKKDIKDKGISSKRYMKISLVLLMNTGEDIEFRTQTSLAKYLGLSLSKINRMINKEVPFDGKYEIVRKWNSNIKETEKDINIDDDDDGYSDEEKEVEEEGGESTLQNKMGRGVLLTDENGNEKILHSHKVANKKNQNNQNKNKNIRKNPKDVYILLENIINGKERVFETQKDAAIFLECKTGNIWKPLYGYTKTIRGYKAKFIPRRNDIQLYKKGYEDEEEDGGDDEYQEEDSEEDGDNDDEEEDEEEEESSLRLSQKKKSIKLKKKIMKTVEKKKKLKSKITKSKKIDAHDENNDDSFISNKTCIVLINKDGNQKKFKSQTHVAQYFGLTRSKVGRSLYAKKPIFGYTLAKLKDLELT